MEEAFYREKCSDERSWLDLRAHPTYAPYRITATNASVICGDSPWQSACDLWDEKKGIAVPKDISDKPYIQYGKKMEEQIRNAAVLDLPYFSIEYHAYDILTNKRRPWMSATLDAELTVIAENPWNLRIGKKGTLECKTGSFRNSRDLEEWYSGLPQNYYEQCLHQMNTTEWSFSIVAGRLKRDAFRDDDDGFPEIRNFYRIVDMRNDQTRADALALIGIEEDFVGSLMENRRPPRVVKIGD